MRNSQGASGGEGGDELGAAAGLRAGDTAVAGGEEDGRATGTELEISSAQAPV